MTKTIFRNTFLVGISVLILCAGLFFGMRYTQVKEETFSALASEAVYAEQGLIQGGAEYLDSVDGGDRITWIAGDGKILFDSENDSIAGQLECPEVAAALETGEGQSIRRAENDGRTTIFFARLCADGTILRLGRPMSAVRYAFATVSPVLWVIVLVLMISGVLAFRAARQIVQPINAMNLDDPDPDTYPELSPLVSRILEQKLTIQEEVEQREKLRREFSANVSHELKTPLTSISGFAELMSQGVVPPEKVREFSGDIYKESQRMIALVDDIIRLSKLDEGGGTPEWETVDLYALSEETLDSLRLIAERQNVSLELAGGHCQVRGIWQLLSEMEYNLCDNAIKYNRPGGSVRVEVSEDTDNVILKVSDTGIGIPPAHQKRVFERFYRVDKSHSKEIGGTGLGLSIVKHGAQFHNARVELTSEVGLGTTVTILFPKMTEE